MNKLSIVRSITAPIPLVRPAKGPLVTADQAVYFAAGAFWALAFAVVGSLLSGCAAADSDPYERPVVIDVEPSALEGVVPDLVPNLGDDPLGHQYAGPIVKTLTVSDKLDTEQLESVAQAFDAWASWTNGRVTLAMQIGPTVCGGHNSIHAPALGDCHLTQGDDGGWHTGWNGGGFEIEVAQGKRGAELYVLVAHELGHAMGLPHSNGLMTASYGAGELYHPWLNDAHFNTIANARDWWRPWLPYGKLEEAFDSGSK